MRNCVGSQSAAAGHMGAAVVASSDQLGSGAVNCKRKGFSLEPFAVLFERALLPLFLLFTTGFCCFSFQLLQI